MLQKRKWFSDIVLLGVTFIWGLTFVLVQNAIATIPPFSFVALRFGCAALLLLPFTRREQDQLLPSLTRRELAQAGVWLGIWLFLGYALQTFSLLYTTPGKSGFLTGMSVALVPILALIILRIQPTLSALLGVGLATVGLYLLAFVNLSSINRGDLLAFLCAIAFGLQVVYTGKFSSHTSVQRLVVIQLATVALLSTVAAAIFEPWQRVLSPHVLLQPTVIIALVVTAVFATAFAYLAQTHIQKYTTPTQVALIFASEPVFAALADYWWNGTGLSTRAIIGCVLILGGTLLTELKWLKWLRRS